MKNILLIMVSLLFSEQVWAQLTIVDSLSSIRFTVKHLGIPTSGSFSNLKGEIYFDKDQVEKAKVDVSVDVKTIRTGIELRDSHLKGDGYFDANRYPFMHFTSTKVERKTKDLYTITGKLTIKNHSKEVTVPFSRSDIPGGQVFKAYFNLNRKEYGIGGTSVISENVDISLAITTWN